MKIGLIAQLHGRPGGRLEPSWKSIVDLALTAEAVGFDMFVFEDALLYRGKDHTEGCWESGAIAAALAASTTGIRLGQSVVNAPYRSATLTAAAANTLDEISGGRYVLGIGAGNTDDYEAFGFASDKRYSRFAEAIHIIHGLLKEGRISYEGTYHQAADAELVLRGPSREGPQINVAAGSPKMLGLVARYADQWNWWGWNETSSELIGRLRPIVALLEQACEQAGRDPLHLERTLDLYSVVPPGLRNEDPAMTRPVGGSAGEIAEYILSMGELGFVEVRCDLTDKTSKGVEHMAEVVELVHAG